MSVIIQLKGGTAAKWQEVNPTLAEREMGIETDTHNYKIGDGFTSWNSLEYSSFPQNAEDGGIKLLFLIILQIYNTLQLNLYMTN